MNRIRKKSYDVKHFLFFLSLSLSLWKITGSFSRLEYMKGTAMLGDPSSGGPASFAEITEQIPLTAHTLYYRDAIGNVSTSQYVHKNDALLVQLGRC